MPGTLRSTCSIFPAVRWSIARSLPNSLTAFSPFTPDAASSTLSSMYWEKLKSTPGKLASSAWLICVTSFALSTPAGPSLAIFQRRQELGLEEAGRISAVIGPAMLRDDRLNLWKALDELAHAIDIVLALLERDRRRHGRADPEIALLEMGQ